MFFDTPQKDIWEGHLEFGNQLSLISKLGYRLPPGANAQPMIINLELAPPFSEDLRISGKIGSTGSRQYEILIKASKDHVERQYKKFLAGTSASEFSRDEKKKTLNDLLSENEV